MKNTVNISVNVPVGLAKKLEKVASFEERPKSYYIKKGLAEILEEKLQDMHDYIEARKAHEEFLQDNRKSFSSKEVFKNLK